MTHPRTEAAPTGDSIAKTISNRDNRHELPYSDLAKDLTNAHAHRPGMWQQDLAKVNQALHDKGLLPGLDIVGTNGQDLITRNKDGKTVIVDATGHTRQRVDDGVATSQSIGDRGRTAELGPDGSGKYTVKKGDNSWTIAADVLKSQGGEKPTNNQIANYIKELQNYNGIKDLGKLQPGQEIKIPPRVTGGDKTEFTRARADDQIKDMTKTVEQNYDLAAAAAKKFAGTDTPFMQQTIPPSITKADIAKALTDTNITNDERKGLQFLQKNYDALKYTGGAPWKNDVIFQSGITDWKTNQLKLIETTRIAYDR